MKKAILITLVAIAASAVSCSVEPLGETGIGDKGEGAIVFATLEQHECTRTSLDSDGLRVIWNQGDSFSAFGAGGEKSKFTLTGGAGTGEGEFAGSFSGQGPYILLYPHSDNATFDGDCLNFELPSIQQYVTSNICSGTSPSVALCSASNEASFRNLCGILKVTVKGRGQCLNKIVLQDLAGNMLWGEASLKIDGKQGTDQQTMTLSGGDNTLILKMNGITINTTTAKDFYFVVPVGALDGGFTLAFHTLEGKVFGFLQTQADNRMDRSAIVKMPVATTSGYTEPADERARGYYKDLFMDGGIYLTSRTTLPSAEYLNISMEYFASNATGKFNNADTTFQNQIFKGYEDDTNGVLLYPDGEPRFRLIYVNGGNSREHGKSLYPEGLENIRTFVENGGSFTGSCAGSFLSSKGYDTSYPYKYYTAVWPGHTYHTRTDKGVSVKNTYTSLSVEPGCPLLNYYNLGTQVDGVRHNGGSYVKPADADFPVGTEILMRYLTPGEDSTNLNGSVNAWAYKASSTTGRVVVSGSHPEGVTSGKQLYYMASMLSYAMDGNAPSDVKNIDFGSTAKGIIGDLQYHHYKVSIPDGKKKVIVSLSSEADVNLFLTLRKEGKAFFTDSQYTLTSDGANKQLSIKGLETGEWYIGVYCATTVTSVETGYLPAGTYFKYSGRTDILNGVKYSLCIYSPISLQ